MLQSLIKELESEKEQKTIGSGWISGVFALLFALLSLLSVFILHYPDILTTQPIRQAIDPTLFRSLVYAFIITGFLLASISLILRQNKIFGMSAMILIFVSIILGGSAAQASMTSTNMSIGLDWLLINLLLTGLIFLPIERLFRRIEQSVFRFEWKDDLLYFAVGSLFVQTLTFLSMYPTQSILSSFDLSALHQTISSQPLVLQLIEVMFLTDFVQYWLHRALHKVPFLWKFHAVHHSTKAMDWLAASRMHFLEIIVLRALTVIPMYVLGFDASAIYIYIIIVYLYSTYIHANVRFDIEFLKPFIVTPRFHHWHHGIEKEAIDVNFAIHFPIFDRLFGSYHMPKGRWPEGYGIKGDMPKGYLKQFVYPFSKSKKR